MTPDQLHTVLETAVRAPSVHNTQPWRFTVRPDGLDIRADRSRTLRQQDPGGRELAISCGAAAAHARLAVRGLGLACHSTVLPEGYDRDLLVRLTVGGPQPLTEPERCLLEAVPLRRTDRTPHSAERVPAALLTVVAEAAEADGAWVRVLDDAEAAALRGAAAVADRLQRQQPDRVAEAVSWVRDEACPRDGVPARSLAAREGLGGSLLVRPNDVRVGGPMMTEDPPAAEHPALLVLGTAGDGAEDWVRAGLALSDLLLTATAHGLVASPMTQVLELPTTRGQLAMRLGLLGRPQVVLRVGWPVGAGSPPPGRRLLADVVTPA